MFLQLTDARQTPGDQLRKYSRRSFLCSLALGTAVSQANATGSGSQPSHAEQGTAAQQPTFATVGNWLKVNDLDRRIWEEELDEFVPARLYDVHSHLTRSEFNLDRDVRQTHPSAVFQQAGSVALLNACESLLYPGRQVMHLLLPQAHKKCNFEASNQFIAQEALKEPETSALMLVHPKMTAEEVDRAVVDHRFVGFKPYRFYSVTGNVNECRITDFMPEHQVAVANRYGLVILLHVSKRAAIADSENLDDLERLTAKYGRVRWLLAHCARSYSAWALERAASRLRHIPNLWFETSSVCETDAFDALFSNVDFRRTCYGSDDFPVGVTRGKYITYGHGWSEMNEVNQNFDKSHCDGRMTFVRYEMLRAIRRAARHAGLSRSQVADLFYNNAAQLIDSVRKDLAQAL